VLVEKVREAYDVKEREIGAEALRYLERMIMLQIVDTQWKDHLLNMDHLKEGIGLRGYGQRDPLVEYKKEAFDAFIDVGERISTEGVNRLFKIQIAREGEVEKKLAPRPARLHYGRERGGSSAGPVVRNRKIGRNDPCICGSGKKYKKCCGQNV
jgi:preprotein translocase subunit SecA